MATISYIAEVEDGTHSRSFSIPLTLSDREMADLRSADPSAAGTVLTDLVRRVQSAILTAEPWLCVVCGTRRAARMINTPAFCPDPNDGGPPVVADYTPYPICPDPECNLEGIRRTQTAIRGAARLLRMDDPDGTGSRFRDLQAVRCDRCGTIESREGGAHETVRGVSGEALLR